MKNNNYERASMIVISFAATDVITTSGWAEDDGPIVLPDDIF